MYFCYIFRVQFLKSTKNRTSISEYWNRIYISSLDQKLRLPSIKILNFLTDIYSESPSPSPQKGSKATILLTYFYIFIVFYLDITWSIVLIMVIIAPVLPVLNTKHIVFIYWFMIIPYAFEFFVSLSIYVFFVAVMRNIPNHHQVRKRPIKFVTIDEINFLVSR